MMKRFFIAIMLISFLFPYAVFGQLKSQDKPVQIKHELIRSINDQFLGLSIFDPSRFHMSHSVSMSYFTLGGKGISQSLYLNTMSYQLSNPLLLKVQWGVQNFPYNSLAKNHPAFQSGFFFSGAELQYKPNDKFEMRLQYNRLPASMYYSNHYWYDSPFRPYRSFLRDWDEKR